MAAPPPPPPPPPPANLGPPKPTAARSQLLSQIHQGAKLKKTVTNDRSAPKVGGRVAGEPANTPAMAESAAEPPKPGKVAAPSGLGALFANGVPSKPSAAKTQAKMAMQPKEQSPKPFTPPQPKTPPSVVSSPPSTSSPKGSPLKDTQSEVKTRPMGGVAAAAVAPPPLPAKVKPSLPAVPPAVNKPTSQQPQFQTMRPSKTVNSTLASRRSESTEDLKSPPAITRPSNPPPPPLKRPAAPPPPPPSAMAKPPQLSRAVTLDPSGQSSNAPPPMSIPKGAESPPPPPPPRMSSYVESMEQRFHFLAISELPPPPRFIGFKKEYAT